MSYSPGRAHALSHLRPAYLAVDLVLFTVVEGDLHVVMLERSAPPCAGRWVLPGALLSEPVALNYAANRVLFDKVGSLDVTLEQAATFADPERDPRGWVVSAAFVGAAPAEWLKQFTGIGFEPQLVRVWIDEATGKLELSLDGLPVPPGFDHRAIIRRVLTDLRARLDLSLLPFALLPYTFTLLELQEVHEAVLGTALNKPLFRKRLLERIFADGTRLEPTGEHKSGPHRPAQYYRRRIAQKAGIRQ